MKKIFFYTENYERGGNARYLLDVCTLAQVAGHSGVVYTNKLGFSKEETSWFTGLEFEVKEASIRSWGEWRNVYNLRRSLFTKVAGRLFYLPFVPLVTLYQLILFYFILKKEKPDMVVAANGGYPAGGSVLRVALMAWLLNIPIITSAVAQPSFAKSDRLRMLFWNPILPGMIHKFLVNTETIKIGLQELGFQKDKIVVFYNGLMGNLPYKTRNNAKTKILYFSRLEIKKGTNVLIQAFEKLSIDKNKIELHFYGSGALENEVANLATKYPLTVFYHGFKSGNAEEIFVESDIYVLPTFIEGLPYSVMEAMRAGCCVLSTAVGGIPELIDSDKEGILIRPDNVQELQNALELLLKDSSLREKFGRAAKAKYDNKFERNAIIQSHIKLFDS